MAGESPNPLLREGPPRHAENKNPSSSSSSSSSSTSAPASTGGRGLTPAEVETVGQTFTYKGKRPVAPQDNGVGVGMLETTRPHDRTMATQAQTHKQALLSLTFVKLESPSGDGPLERLSLALTTSATVDGKVMLVCLAPRISPLFQHISHEVFHVAHATAQSPPQLATLRAASPRRRNSEMKSPPRRRAGDNPTQ